MQKEVINRFLTPDGVGELRDRVGVFTFLEWGRIDKVVDERNVVVQIWRADCDEWELVNAELVGVGSIDGSVGTAVAGQTCLLLYSRTPIASLHNRLLAQNSEEFEVPKCLPMSCKTVNQKVLLSWVGDELVAGGEEFSVEIGTSYIQLNGTGITIDINADGSLKKDNGVWCEEVDSEGNWKRGSGYSWDNDNQLFNWLNLIEQNADGSLKIQTAGAVNDANESFGQTQIEMAADGSMSIKTGVDKDDKQLTGIVIDTTGNVSITTYDDGKEKASFKINHNGTISITTTDSYSITGTNGVVIDGKDGKVSIKNGQKNLYTILSGMLDILNESLATQGSPAAHTVVPNQFKKQAADLDALME